MIPIIDYRTIPQREIPLIISCNQENITGEAIDFSTGLPNVPPCCHSMNSIDQGEFVSQSPGGYNEIPMRLYMVPKTQLIFVELVNCNSEFIAAFRASVLGKLNGPPWRKAYNWLQIVGQAVHLPWLSWPGIDDCSQDTIFHLKVAAPKLPPADNEIIQAIGNNSNPEEFLAYQLNFPGVFNAKYFYDSNNGGIIV